MLARYYEVLGVDRQATREEITAAYRRAAMRWHPDRNMSNPEATEKFQEIEQAYRFLMQLTPSISRYMPPDAAAAAAAAAAPSDAEIDAAVAAWRKLRDAENRRRREFEQQRTAEQEREQAALSQRWRFASPALALLLLAAAGVCWWLLAYPLDVVATSACLLLALLVCPRDDKDYTGMILRLIIQHGVRLYFVVLLFLLLLKVARRLVA